MCFEQPRHKWLLETHVASRYVASVIRAEFVPWFSFFGGGLVTLGWGFNHCQRR